MGVTGTNSLQISTICTGINISPDQLRVHDSPASAQIKHTVEVKVLFRFKSEGKFLPASDYRVKVDKQMDLVALTSLDISQATLPSNKDGRAGEDGQTYLLFRRYCNRWTLPGETSDEPLNLAISISCFCKVRQPAKSE